jgi:ATP-dependent DNA ligase
MAFDLLYQDRRDLSARPLRDHLARLEDPFTGSSFILAVQYLASDCLEARAQALRKSGTTSSRDR